MALHTLIIYSYSPPIHALLSCVLVLQFSRERSLYAACVHFAAACGRAVVVASTTGVRLAEQRALQDAAFKRSHAMSARVLRPDWRRAGLLRQQPRRPAEYARPAYRCSCSVCLRFRFGLGSRVCFECNASTCSGASLHDSVVQ